MKKRPNFIIFITDQHRADWLGCYGHPVIKTPNIDKLPHREPVLIISMLLHLFACPIEPHY